MAGGWAAAGRQHRRLAERCRGRLPGVPPRHRARRTRCSTHCRCRSPPNTGCCPPGRAEAAVRRLAGGGEQWRPARRAALLLDVLSRELVLPKPKLTRPLALEPYLRAVGERGLRERGLGGDLAARARLREELAIIEANGLAGYFLTVRDIAREARRRGHTMALRGSAGNSLVCYLLGITDVDPLRFGQALERFLHLAAPTCRTSTWTSTGRRRRDHRPRHRPPRAECRPHQAHQFYQPRSAFRDAGKLHGLSTGCVSELLTHLEQVPRRRRSSLGEKTSRSAGRRGCLCRSRSDGPRLVGDACWLLGWPMQPSAAPRRHRHHPDAGRRPRPAAVGGQGGADDAVREGRGRVHRLW
ncbi:MAG: hypothetical protein U0736_13735 [Gemmataceae bacterium]